MVPELFLTQFHPSPRRIYSVIKEGEKVVLVKAVPSHASKVSCRKETYTVIRQYGIHKGTPKFRRIISSVRDSSGTEIPKAILQYFFVGGEKISVDILPHGNSSRNPRPYMRTQPSTLKNLKEVSKIKSPILAYNQMLQVCESKHHSLSTEPRNKDQIYNARRVSSAR